MNEEIYKLFLVGIFIFAFQQVFVELWIKPLKDFYVILKRLESFLIKYAYLSQVVWGQNEILDKELREGRDKIREYAGDMIASYDGLPIFEKLWVVKIKKYKISDAKKSLIRLSNLIGNNDETRTLNLRVLASKEIDKIRQYLKFDLD